MKKLVLITAFFVGITSISFAQVEITGYSGWQFGSITNGYNGKLRIKNAQDYGGMLAFEVRPDMQIELGYMYSPTRAVFERYGKLDIDLGDVDIHYYQIGGVSPHAVSNNVDAFGSFTLGATYFDIKQQSVTDPDLGTYQLSDYTSFSITLGGGAKIWLGDSKKVGIKLQGRLLMPITWGGLSIGCGWGGGCGTGVTVGSALFSGDLLGGIVLRLGD